MESGSAQETIHRMQQDMLWCEQLLAVRWDTPDAATGGCLQHAIESRRVVASAASDTGQHELVQALCAPLYDVSETSGWEKVEADARYQHASLVCFYANYRSGERRQAGGTDREHGINDLLEVALPYVDRVCQDIADGSVRLCRLKSIAYAWAIASIRELDRERVYELMHEVLALVRSQPDQLAPRKALFVAIDALIRPQEEILNAREIRTILLRDLCTIDACMDERSWLVGTVGVLAKLAAKRYPEDEELYLSEMQRLQAAWNRECLRDGNIGYAAFNAFDFLGKYLPNHSQALTRECLQNFITDMLKTANRKGLSILAAQKLLFNAILDHAPEAFANSVIDRYLHPLGPGERVGSPVDYASGLEAICHTRISRTGNWPDEGKLGEVWDLVQSAPGTLRRPWFEALSRTRLGRLPPSVVSIHLNRLLALRADAGMEPNDPDYEAWSKALLATLTCVSANTSGPEVMGVLDSEDLSDSDTALWACALAIVAPGKGRKHPETVLGWADNLARIVNQRALTEQDAEPWMAASCTLVGELLAAGDSWAAVDMISLYERTLDGLRTAEDG